MVKRPHADPSGVLEFTPAEHADPSGVLEFTHEQRIMGDKDKIWSNKGLIDQYGSTCGRNIDIIQ
jgi:hypothetical protein